MENNARDITLAEPGEVLIYKVIEDRIVDSINESPLRLLRTGGDIKPFVKRFHCLGGR